MTQWRSIKKAVERKAAVESLTWHVSGDVATGTNLLETYQFPYPVRLRRAYAVVETAPTDADILIDINVAGTTVFTAAGDRITIAATEKEGETTGFAGGGIHADVDENVTMDVDQVGSTIAGADLTVVLEFEPVVR